jgi:hypothetical protein
MKETLNTSQKTVRVLLWLSVPIALALSATAWALRATSVGWRVSLAASIGWAVTVVGFEICRNYFEWDTSLVKDLRLIGGFFAYTYFTTLVLLAFGLLTTTQHPASFWHARVEFFFTWGIFLAITGAVYAIFAKNRADAVFDKSEEILRNITSFFTDYEQIMGDDPRAIPALIRKSERKLTILIGSPLIGFFRREEIGTKFFTCLLAKLKNNNLRSGFEIEFLCWNDTDCSTYINRTGVNQDDFIEQRNTLIRAIKSKGGKVHYFKTGIDPGFRCIISDGEAIFWVLSDPTPGGAERERQTEVYEGGGFTTDRAQMIDILSKLFRKTVEKDSEAALPNAGDEGLTPSATDVSTGEPKTD